MKRIIGWSVAIMGLTCVGAAIAQAGFVDVASAAHTNHQGTTVLWGGRVVARDSSNGQPCIEVAALPLDAKDGKPNPMRQTGIQQAHFYACGDSLSTGNVTFGKLVTVAGTLGATQERRSPRKACMATTGPRINRRVDVDACVLQIPVVAVSDSRAWQDLKPGRQPALLQPAYPFN